MPKELTDDIKSKIYHIGASLKDLGKKWFGFSRLNLDKELIISRLYS